MNDSDWFEVTEGTDLLQGDILPNCPLFVPDGELTWPLPEHSRLGLRADLVDLIILTQSCDLANNKVAEVLLARVVAWPDVVRDEVRRGNEAIKSSRFRKQLVEGSVPALSLLHKRASEPRLDWSVVAFQRLSTLPKIFLGEFAATLGPRLRLRSPYREHLAQAFARYFMRVGLPHDARAFEKEGDVKL
ncbi:MAG TPA: hypothetical protein VN688_20650 [Gemmataceae bacterium]|nr:hypothetical protein [Gemmataceae bacterium]